MPHPAGEHAPLPSDSLYVQVELLAVVPNSRQVAASDELKPTITSCIIHNTLAAYLTFWWYIFSELVILCHYKSLSGFAIRMERNVVWKYINFVHMDGSVAEWLTRWTQHRRAWVQIAVEMLSGNSLRQTVHTHRASVHQAAKLAAALLRVARVTAGLAESNGSLQPGLWLMSPASWLPRTGIRPGTLCSVIEYGLPLPFFLHTEPDTDKIIVNQSLQTAVLDFHKLTFQIRLTHTRLTALYLGLPGWASTRKVKPIWILLKQETVSGSGIHWAICKSAPRSRQYRPDALPATQPTVSKNWRQFKSDLISHKIIKNI